MYMQTQICPCIEYLLVLETKIFLVNSVQGGSLESGTLQFRFVRWFVYRIGTQNDKVDQA